MTWTYLLVTLVIALVAASGLTFVCRKAAYQGQTLDVPNARSSHSVVTPTAGGWSIVAVLTALCVWLGQYENQYWMWAVAGVVVALVGFVDDKRQVNPGMRLLVHAFAGVAMVTALSGLTTLWIFGRWVDLGLFGNLIAITGVVWMINLYNFMDGINGLAASQALLSCAVMFGLLLLQADITEPLVILHAVAAAAVAGFLFWNFPVAKIFLGDTGSGYLGFMVAILMLASAKVDPVYFWCWLIMLGVFVVDATYTLLVRWRRNYKLSEAHCSHAYQRAAQRYKSHTKVTLTVVLINLVWLAPLATVVALEWVDGATMLLVAYAPLFGLVWWLKAGEAC